MIHSGPAITVQMLDDGIAEFKFDLQNESVNKFNRVTLDDLDAAVQAVKAHPEIRGLLVTSGKNFFIVGADITEFGGVFAHGRDYIQDWTMDIHRIFNAFEDLDIPKVVAINGFALGGGFEMCLANDYRVMSDKAQVGLPELTLGLIPGFGGIIRLARVIGVAKAIEWISSTRPRKAADALADDAVDEVAEHDKLRDTALAALKRAIAGEIDWQAKRALKLQAVEVPGGAADSYFEGVRAELAKTTNPEQYPASKAFLDVIEKSADMARDQAVAVEAEHFAGVAVTPQADALIGLFLADQVIKRAAKKNAAAAREVKKAAVLGAGIMGGGIAYQAATKGTAVIMKDIGQAQLDLGMNEAEKQLARQLQRGRISEDKKNATLKLIEPSLSYDGFNAVDIVIEAVTENIKVKEIVLKEAENALREDAILASNTSTISITELAKGLQRPANFVGMHFFNPVPVMPLVEVIRGEQSSDEAIATAVALALSMGKSPIVVQDCPGFLVNRVLFPYFGAFDRLIKDGACLIKIDQVMEDFGWPMGPAYLSDVIGLDTCVHASKVLADGFPDRMKADYTGATEALFKTDRLGQKNGKGFYKYVADDSGRKRKTADDEVKDILAPHVDAAAPGSVDFTAEEIRDRLMLAMCNEVARCIDEKIVASPEEADMALIMGLGFPRFRGGALRYIDQIGLKEYVALCDRYAHLGKAYEAPQILREMAAKGERFFN
ncbi:fatty acid oxidation complex subunit alpha FadB [Oligella urethralis]|uniref:fatty acid oxidation complex subunit alpha FadB n=1 Tax=Oligella urethralis TaxID=90245 RepID=UPI000C99DAB4|nr:fatty acid oxidation complex subunit alpha FadB [Oligella urethralis]PMC19301.1 fatty acid oxidation complex subunit alpha FadB [Oligella urethralis]